MSSKDKEEPRKKPVKGYCIPSRYKQVAEGISKLSSHSKDSTRDGKSTKTSVLSSTAFKDRVALPSIDASAITLENSTKDQGSSAEFSTSAVPKQKESSTKYVGTKPKKKQERKTNQSSKKEKEIDFLYIEYLQAKLCESKAKKALEMKSKKAVEKIHESWRFMELLLERNFAVKRELEFVDYLINLNERLKGQARFLLPNLDMLDVLEKKFEKISTNVDLKQHELGVINIKLPEPGSEGEIVKQVEQINSLLNSIMSYIQNCEEIVLNAETVDMLSEQGKLATEDLERGYQLVDEVTDLLLNETSMRLAS